MESAKYLVYPECADCKLPCTIGLVGCSNPDVSNRLMGLDQGITITVVGTGGYFQNYERKPTGKITCPNCDGTKVLNGFECRRCEGTGQVTIYG